MARTSTQEMLIRLGIDSSSASAQVAQLGEKMDALKQKIIADEQAIKSLTGFERKLAEEQLKLDQQTFRHMQTTQQAVQRSIDSTSRALDDLSGVSMFRLRQAYTDARAELNRLTRGTAEYDEALERTTRLHQAYTNAVETQNAALEEGGNKQNWFAKQLESVGEKIKNAFTIDNIVSFVSESVDNMARMDDAYADVIKTTGMTRDEVLKLNDAFKDMNTRTSREELNKLAADAGKLGVAKAQIEGFVEAGNMINVALGEDLGGDAIKNIGKIAEVFKTAQKDLESMTIKEQMLAIGSAINSLGQASTASEGYMVDFMGRMGGIAAQTGLTVQQVMGYASALDQLKLPVEMASTAMGTLVTKMFEDPAKFAKIAGQDIQEFNVLLQTDTNAAVKTLLDTLGQKGGFAALAPVFKEMGTEGSRAIQVIASLAGNMNLVNEAQDLANQEFARGSSIIDEYKTKNETLQASLDKSRKEFEEIKITIAEKLYPALITCTNGLSAFIKFLTTNSGELIYWAAAIAGMTIAIQAKTIATTLATTATTLFSRALNGLRVAIMTNPIGAIVAGLTALAAITIRLVQHFGELKTHVRDTFKEVGNAQAEANKLFDALERTVQGTEEYNNILKTLQEKYPQYLKNMVDEQGNLINVAAARQAVNEGLERTIVNQRILAKENEINGQKIDRQADRWADIVEKLREKYQLDESTISKIRQGIELSLQQYEKGDLTLQQFLGNSEKALANEGIKWSESVTLLKNFRGVLMGLASDADNAGKKMQKVYDAYGRVAQSVPEEVMPAAAPAATTKTITPVAATSSKSSKGSSKKEKAEDPVKAIELEYQRRKLAISQGIAEEGKTQKVDTQKWHDELVALDLEFAQKRIDATKAGTMERVQAEQAMADLQIKINDDAHKRLEGIFNEQMDNYKANITTMLDNGIVTKEQYEQQLDVAEEAFRGIMQASQDAGMKEVEIEQWVADMRVKIATDGFEKVNKALKDSLAEQQESLRLSYLESEAYTTDNVNKRMMGEIEYNMRSIQLRADSLREQVALYEAAGADTAALQVEQAALMADYDTQVAAIKREAMNSEAEFRRDKALADAEYLAEEEIISEEEKATKMREIWIKYVDEKYTASIQGIKNVIGQTSQAVGQLMQVLTQQIKNRYDKELSEATKTYNSIVDSAYASEEEKMKAKEDFDKVKADLDYKYRCDELELQKKAANAVFAIKVGEMTAEAALGVITAWSTLGLIPIVGTGLAIAATGLIATQLGFGIAAANLERERVMGLTIEAPAPSQSSSLQTSNTQMPSASTTQSSSGNRVSASAYGYATGGYTGDGDRLEPAGIVHKGEYVVPQWMMRELPALNYVRALEAIRTNRAGYEARPHYDSMGGYADGGEVLGNEYGYGSNDAALADALRELTATLNWYQNNYIRCKADIVLSELDAKHNEWNFLTKKS